MIKKPSHAAVPLMLVFYNSFQTFLLLSLVQADANLEDGEDPAILLNSVLGFFFPVCYLPPAKVKLR
jgi:hypothetical protein